MKIDAKILNGNKTTFDNLEIGDTFNGYDYNLGDHCLYLKISETTCYNLETDRIQHCNLYEEVEPIKTKLVLDN